MRKFKLNPICMCVNTAFGLCEDHNRELKESDFPEGNADKLVKNGHLVEIIEKKEVKEKKKK